MSQSAENPKVQSDSKEVQRHGLTNEYGVLKFRKHLILGKHISEVIQSNIKVHKKDIGSALLEFCEDNR